MASNTMEGKYILIHAFPKSITEIKPSTTQTTAKLTNPFF